MGDDGAREAIWFSGCSFESSLKTAVMASTGQAKELVQQFSAAGFMDDIPADKAKALVKVTLLGLAVLRNELGGHGQGQNVVMVPRAYGELAVHLAASLNYFVAQQWLRKNPPPLVDQPAPEVDLGPPDDGIPF